MIIELTEREANMLENGMLTQIQRKNYRFGRNVMRELGGEAPVSEDYSLDIGYRSLDEVSFDFMCIKKKLLYKATVFKVCRLNVIDFQTLRSEREWVIRLGTVLDKYGKRLYLGSDIAKAIEYNKRADVA